ncbi:MAG: imidazole glycerol phosphate synthase subunit HisH [Eubacteriales bacterium]|nr:imidazole glycerol phosphate synthase subunit HisH [Eubacteriales bacterium]
MVGIVDYGVGNLFSLQSSFAFIGAEVTVTADADVLAGCDRILLPGVGAFEDAARKLRESGLASAVLDAAQSGKPLLGVCLGMQMLFERSFEYGEHEGLGLLRGSVKPIRPVIGPDLKVPHIGWNALHFPKDKPVSPLFRYIREGDFVYFVHSFAAMDCADSVIAETEYGASLTAAAACGNVFGCQFHPEKSGTVGLNILRAFCETS